MNSELGNRMRLPLALRGPHFFYRTQLPAYRQEDARLLVQSVERAVEDCGLHTAEIDVFSRKRLSQYGGDAAPLALERMIADLGLQSFQSGAISVLACEWASVHVDESYTGSSFLNLVLHTGPGPYVMQTLHSEKAMDEEGAAQLSVHTSTRVLHPGQAVVFDPATPHLAVPTSFNCDQLLVLLQVELPDNNPEQRADILRRFPPLDGDSSQEGIFNGFDS